MGRKVVTVEPFHDNILRIHKAAYLEKTYKNILLIKNAISNKRNEIKLLKAERSNIGGQSLLDHKDKIYKKDKNNKYLVETILFDDIVPYLPYKNDTTKERFKKAILKIDAMIDFLYLRKYLPYGNNNLLGKNNWKSWPWDIIWKLK